VGAEKDDYKARAGKSHPLVNSDSGKEGLKVEY